MARIADHNAVYWAFETFKSHCLLDEMSLLWPGHRSWTPENVAEVKRLVVDNPKLDDRQFEVKLDEQMGDASHDHWIILADIAYMYYLIPHIASVRLATKKQKIGWAAAQAAVDLPADNETIWQPLTSGITRTGQRYNGKYRQYWLLLAFADYVKGASSPQQIFEDHVELKRVLTELRSGFAPVDQAHDMVNALLYLAFPDHFEPIINVSDKHEIVKLFGDRLSGPVPLDVDDAIYAIREALESDYGPGMHLWSLAKSKKLPPSEKPVNPVAVTANRDVASALDVLGRTRNVILYGPPGTGKTFTASQVARTLVAEQVNRVLPESLHIRQVISALTLHDVLALSMYTIGKDDHFSIQDLLDQKLIRARYQSRSVEYPQKQLSARLQSHTSPESETVRTTRRNPPFLFDKDSESRWFLTADGQEHVEHVLASSITNLQSIPMGDPETFIKWVTFHQSYSYEDFVEGLRPVPVAESGEISYEIVPGIFRRVSSLAAGDPSNKYVLVIDEINRGNISKIFGELITLVEDDKRAGAPNELRVLLPYSGDMFSIPENLYVIGTMNTADRSIALLDVALRRRFAFIELMPMPELLSNIIIHADAGSVSIEKLLVMLNSRISDHLDRDHRIGHSYFLGLLGHSSDAQYDQLEYVWNHQVVPLLSEYFYSQPERLAEILPFGTGDQPGRETGEELMLQLAKLANEKSL